MVLDPKFVHWSNNPDRNEDWAKEERQRIGEERFRREHECEFIAFDETLINGIKLITLQGTQPLVKHGQVRWYPKIQKGNTYMVSRSQVWVQAETLRLYKCLVYPILNKLLNGNTTKHLSRDKLE